LKQVSSSKRGVENGIIVEKKEKMDIKNIKFYTAKYTKKADCKIRFILLIALYYGY